MVITAIFRTFIVLQESEFEINGFLFNCHTINYGFRYVTKDVYHSEPSNAIFTRINK